MTQLRTAGAATLLLSLLSLAYFLAAFETTAVTEKQTIGSTTIGGDRVHNIGLMQIQQNAVIASCTGVIAGLLMLLLGDKAPDTRPTSGIAMRVKGGLQCPRCGTINPDGSTRCDCGFRFT